MIINSRDSRITKEFILSQIRQEDIFAKYLNISGINEYLGNNNTMFCNTTRSDSEPTCTFRIYPNGIIWFRDWADSKGYDCFGLVQHLYNNCSFYDALELIAHHFGLLDKETSEQLRYVIDPNKRLEVLRQENPIPTIRIKSRPFTQRDINYWKQYHLDIKDLDDDIYSLHCYWFNDNKHNIGLTELGFAYDGRNYDYKLYFPDKNRKKGEIKHLHNNGQMILGEKYLKYDKMNLIITSSKKDIQVLKKLEKLYNLDYEVIAPASETCFIKKEKISFYHKKYSNLIIYNNNDRAGIEAAERQSKEYNCYYIHNPTGTEKDPSDYIKENGVEKTHQLLQSLLFENVPPF